jgi:hypothetical protein
MCQYSGRLPEDGASEVSILAWLMPSIAGTGGAPASSRSVGIQSVLRKGVSMTRPFVSPGPRTIRGTRSPPS